MLTGINCMRKFALLISIQRFTFMAIITKKIPNVILRSKKGVKGKTYHIEYSLNGKRVRRSLGLIDNNTANQLRAEKINELLRSNGITTPVKNIGLKEAVDIHFDLKKKKLRPKTISSYKNYRDRIINAINELGAKNYDSLRTITEGRFNLLAQKIIEKYDNPHTVNNTLTFLKAVENTAIRKGYLDKKFSQDIVISKPEPKLIDQYYTQDELNLIWDKCDRFYIPIYKLIASTGLRLGEVINLTWNNVDFANNQIIINKRIENGKVVWQPKSKSSIRKIPLSDKAKEVILKQKGKHSKFVFISKKGSQLHPNSVYNPFVKARDSAKVDDKGSIHALRHTFASICAQKGLPLYNIGTYLGHSREETTRIYAHLCPSDDAETLNRIGL